MAADRTHLKTKLIPTDQKTDAGRIIYRNAKTGELHSELSITFQYPKGTGLWINIPSIHNGRIYSQKQIMKMLKNGDIQPTSNHTSEAAAIEEAIFRSNNLQHIPATPADYVGANINQKDVVSIDAEVPVADAKIQSKSGVDIKNKAKRIAATTQSRRLAGILDQVDAEHVDDYYQVYPNALQTTRPDKILNKATQYLDQGGQANLDAANAQRTAERESAIGRSMESYEPRTGPEMPKPGSRAGSSADLSMAQNTQHPAYQAMLDRQVNEAENAFQGMDNNRTWGQTFMDAMGNIAGVAGMNYTGDQARADAAVNAAEDAFQNQGTGFPGKRGDIAGSATHLTGEVNKQHPAYAAIIGRAMSAYEPRTTPEMDTGTRSKVELSDITSSGPPRRSSRPEEFKPIYDSGPPRRGSRGDRTKPIVPEYIDVPQNTQIADYGEMPGFKFHSAGTKDPKAGYWSADETSDFWQTDAGYDKAIQTWGEKPGWVKPGYRPKKKELDIDAIKKWFKPSK